MCWVAMDRGARLARMHEEPSTPRSGRRSPTRFTQDICTNGVDERGVFVQRYGATALDASLLLTAADALPAAGRSTHPRDRAGYRR